jgi:hypothetical protein
MAHSVAIYGELLKPEHMKSVFSTNQDASIPCVGNPTEEMSEFPTGVWIPEVCCKYNLVTF